jgi:hypothetical protein
MNNRELLERAAKAAGVQIFVTPDGIMRDGTGQHQISNAFAAPPWNPLTDDGDALRLAVKLELYDLDDLLFQFGTDPLIDTGIDPYAATRRAIVRAAAAMVEPPK